MLEERQLTKVGSLPEGAMVRKVPHLRGERGNALVEFAVTLVVLLTVLFGIIDIGRALYAYDWLYNAARQTTRWAMVRGAFCNPLLPVGCPAGPDEITNYVKNMNGKGLDTSGIDTTQVSVYSHCFAADTPPSNPPCAAPGWVYVQIKYTFHPITPFLSALLRNYNWQMTSSSERVVQN
jgi:hypothetical protein